MKWSPASHYKKIFAPPQIWLISPVLNLDQYTGETLAFLSRWQYTGPALDVLYSANYSGSGNPNTATWTSLTAACAWPIVANDWAASGTVNLGGISGSAVYLAFRYQSTGTTNSTGKLWQLDNIELIGTPVAVINNTDVITYSLGTGAPSGMVIDPTTGVVTWQTDESDDGSHPITILAKDPTHLPVPTPASILVTVTETNQAPTLLPIIGHEVNEHATLSFRVLASDDDLAPNPLTFSLEAGAPAGATIHPTSGVFSWTAPIVSMTETFSVTVIVSDNGSPARDDRQTVAITVMDDHDSWQRSKFGADVDDPAKEATVWGAHADPDRDGTPNVLEFLTARNPLASDENLGPRFRVENGKAIMTYRETKLVNHGVFLLGNWSTDLRSWFYAGLEYAVVQDRGNHNLVEFSMPMDRQKRLMLRLEAYRVY